MPNSTNSLNTTLSLPVFAERLRQKYLASESSVFILYGNVYDRILINQQEYDLVTYLSQSLLNDNKSAIYEVSIDRGLRVLKGMNLEQKSELYGYLENKGLTGILESVERRITDHNAQAVIFPYANMLFSGGDNTFRSIEEKSAITTLHRWSLDENLHAKDNIIILITESLTEINPALVANPRVAAIEIPLPDLNTRQQAINVYAPHIPAESAQRLAAQTAGLRIIQLASIVAQKPNSGLQLVDRLTLIGNLLAGQPQQQERAQKLASITVGMTKDEITALVKPEQPISNTIDPYAEMLTLVNERKRELIEKECAGLIEFIQPKYGLDVVGGNEHIKHELLEIAKVFRAGDRVRSPMGLLAVGAMGAGKTFVIKAFLKEAGLSGVQLKNFRSKWVGSTEANLEKVLSAVKAMGPIAVIIDEGDRSFGKADGDSDGGTSSRVIARLKEFMSDTDNRGQVLFILMTNRPDKLDTDIKRPGRLDRKIPFFYAETTEERINIVRAILNRYKLTIDIDWNLISAQFDQMQGYSNADLEAVALLAVELAARSEPTTIDNTALTAAISDFMPPQETNMIAYMELLAVAETSRRSLLPERYKNQSSGEIASQLQALKVML